MDLISSFKKFNKIRTGVGLVIAGLIFTALSCLFIYMDGKNDTVFAETEGTITNITETCVSVGVDDTEYEYKVLVNYSVNGTEYRDIEYPSYSSSMKEGKNVTVLYNVDDPAEIKAPGSDAIPYVILAAGLILLIVGFVILINGIRVKKEDLNDYDKVDMKNISPEQIAEIENSTEEKERYCFHYDKNLKQGYVMEDSGDKVVYEAVMTKFSLFSPCVYDFVNHFTIRTVTKKIGHTLTTKTGEFFVPSSKAFTVDGINNWEYIASKGYSFEVMFEGLTAKYRVKHFGVEVADIETAGTNAMTGKASIAGNIPVNGIYTVNCRRSDIDTVFFICFSIARAIFFES